MEIFSTMETGKVIKAEKGPTCEHDANDMADEPEPTGDDVISNFYKNGFHGILEKVILNLPLRTVQAFTEVNKTWSSMINFYQNTENSRLQLIREQMVDRNWQLGVPVLDIVNLPGVERYCHSLHHVVMDEEVVVVVGLYSKHPTDNGELFIHIFDAVTFKLILLIPIIPILPKQFHACQKVILNLNKYYLYMTGFLNHNHFWANWDRQNQFTFLASDHEDKPGTDVINWTIGPDGCVTEICLQTYLQNPRNVSRVNRGYKITVDQNYTFSIIFGVSTNGIIVNSGGDTWRKSKRKSLRLVGYNQDQGAIL